MIPSNQVNDSFPLPPTAVKLATPSQLPHVALIVELVKVKLSSFSIMNAWLKVHPCTSVINTLLRPSQRLFAMEVLAPLSHR